MAADVNGFSMGYRDAMIENGVEFFFTNVHCHHGMYPLYQNQNAFFWENASGQRLLVWNGEHYNLGNVLGLQPNHAVNWMMRNRLGEDTRRIVWSNGAVTNQANCERPCLLPDGKGPPSHLFLATGDGVPHRTGFQERRIW